MHNSRMALSLLLDNSGDRFSVITLILYYVALNKNSDSCLFVETEMHNLSLGLELAFRDINRKVTIKDMFSFLSHAHQVMHCFFIHRDSLEEFGGQ